MGRIITREDILVILLNFWNANVDPVPVIRVCALCPSIGKDTNISPVVRNVHELCNDDSHDCTKVELLGDVSNTIVYISVRWTLLT